MRVSIKVVFMTFLFCAVSEDTCRSEPVVVPYELLPGEQYRLAFLTSEKRTAFSPDISEYNNFVTGVANTEPALVDLQTTWRVIGSTFDVEARDNTSTNPNTETGLPIYLLDGTAKIADDNADLWDGGIDHPLNIQQSGVAIDSGPSSVNTGTLADGTSAWTFGHPHQGTSETVTTGFFLLTGHAWIDADTLDGGAIQISRPFYAISNDLTVPKPAPPAGPHGSYQRIAIKGDPATDGNGTLNVLRVTPTVNDHGQVLYVGGYVDTANGPDDEIAAVRYSSSSGLYQQLLRSGAAAPDGNGQLADLFVPRINGDGSAAFYSSFFATNGGIADDQGILWVDASGVHNLAREGGSTPTGNGEYFILNENDFPPLALNDAGQVAVRVDLQNTAGGLTDDEAVIRASAGGALELAREGGPLPSSPGTYGSFGMPAINSSGVVAFRASGITGLGSNSQLAIIRHDGLLGTEVALAGSPAPDGNGVISPFGLDNDVAINDAGDVAFAAGFTGTAGGASDAFAMIRSDGATQRIVARAGDEAPDGNGVVEGSFAAFGKPKLSEFGEVAFLAKYSGTANVVLDDNAIVKAYANDVGREIVEVAREGWTLPGGVGEYFGLSDVVDVNESGVVAFNSSLRNVPGPPFSPLGIFLGDGIDVVEVVRTGTEIEGDEVFEVVSSGLGITEGSLNRHGQVAFNATMGRTGAPTLLHAVHLFTPDLHWRGGTIGAWEERLVQLGEVNDFAMKNWTLSLTPAEVHNVIVERARATAFGTETPFVEITGPSADVTVRNLELRDETRLRLIGNHTFAALDGILLSGGTLSGSGELVGDVLIEPGGALEADGLTTQGNVINDGLLTLAAAVSDYGVFNGAIVNNAQTIIDNANATPSIATFDNDFRNNGQLVVGLNQTAEFIGDYLGAGSIDNDGTIIFHGLGPGASPAHVQAQGGGTIELATSGVTTMELGGTVRGAFHGDPLAQYDSFSSLDGTLDLGGMLTVKLISHDGTAPIFAPSLGDAFSLFEAEQLLGGFDLAPQLPDLGPELRWNVFQTDTLYRLEVVGRSSFLTDFDGDGTVGGGDLEIWEGAFGVDAGGDADGDSDSDGADFIRWQREFGSGRPSAVRGELAPEPSTLALLASFVVVSIWWLLCARRPGSRRQFC